MNKLNIMGMYRWVSNHPAASGDITQPERPPGVEPGGLLPPVGRR